MSESSQQRLYGIVDAEVHDATGRGLPQFDIWLVPDSEVAEFNWGRRHPGGALALVAGDHPAARAAWDAGTIYEDTFPFWRIPVTRLLDADALPFTRKPGSSHRVIPSRAIVELAGGRKATKQRLDDFATSMNGAGVFE
jgi:hypothetical protein